MVTRCAGACPAVCVTLAPQSAHVPMMLVAPMASGLSAPYRGGPQQHLFPVVPTQYLMDASVSSRVATQYSMDAEVAEQVPIGQQCLMRTGVPDQLQMDEIPFKISSGAEPGTGEDDDNESVDGEKSELIPPATLIPTTLAAALTKSQLRRRRRQRAHAAEVAKQQLEDEPSGELEGSTANEDAGRTRALADELLEWLKADTTEDSFLELQQHVRHLTFSDQASSRAVQVALQETNSHARNALASCLKGVVREAMRSMHGNYVVQEIVKELPSATTAWIPQELIGAGSEVARHRLGCRILCRLLEHYSPNDEYAIALFTEVFAESSALIRHAYGTYVVRHGLEFGLPGHRQQILYALWPDVFGNAKHQHGSRVVEAALTFCAEQDQDALVRELTSNPNNLALLAKNVSGRHVVKALLRMPQWSSVAASHLQPFVSEIRESKYGKSVAELVDISSS